MSADVSEADWAVFPELRARALERFSERILEELAHLCADRSRSAHERYGEVYRTVRMRDKTMAGAFDNPRRSMMLVHLAAIDALGLLEPDELSRLSADTRARVRGLRTLL